MDRSSFTVLHVHAGYPPARGCFAATSLEDNVHDWFMAYLRRNQGHYPHDWATLSATLVERFGSHLQQKQALANIMAVCQNRRSVRDYVVEFENYIGWLSSYDEAILLQNFICGLEKDLVEKVSTALPKMLLSAISVVEDLELAICFAHRPPIKGFARTLFGSGT